MHTPATYSPTLRLLAVLELLQSYGQMSGKELARRLEVDARTIRRYIVALQDMGIPVEGERGPHGAYYLQRGYKLPPLMFNDGEAVALTLGLLVLREYGFPVEAVAAEGALAKIERVMPESLLRQVRSLQEAIAFQVTPAAALRRNDFLTELSAAISERRRVHLRYAAWNGEETARAFDAYGIVFNEGVWYTAGFCHLRQGLRTFRLDRVMALEAETATFERPADFDVVAYVQESVIAGPGQEEVAVWLGTTPAVAREFFPEYMGTLEEVEDGVIFRRGAHQLEWTAHVLLNLECPIVVLNPPRLRSLLQTMAERALRMAG